MRHIRRAFAALVIVGTMLGLPASVASAHAVLDNSVPASGATLVESPPQIVLDFDEPVETSLGFIRLFGSDATRVPLPSIARDASDESIVRVDVPALDDDTYVVTYRVVSVDGHPVDGAITFQVGEGDRVDVTSVVADVLGDDGTGAALTALTRAMRLVGYLALALVFAAGLFLLGGAGTAAHTWLLRVAAAAGGAMAVAALGLLGLQGAGLSGGGIGSALEWSTLSDIGDTRVGHALLARAAVGILVTFASAAALRRARDVGVVVRFAFVMAFAVVPLSYAFAGHPGAASPMAPAVAASVVHVLAVGTWFGGLLVLATSSRLREPAAVKWFSQRAVVLVGLAVASGVVQSLLIIDDIGGILDITYGKTLAAKLVFVGIMLLGAAVVRRTFLDSGTQRLRPVLIAEAVAGLLVLSVTSGIVTETPRSAVSAAPFAASLVQGDTIVNVTVSPARVGNVEMHVIVSKPGGSLDPVATVRVRFSSTERDVPPIAVEPAEVGPNHFVATAQIPYAGEWRIDVVIVEVDGRESLVTTPFDVRP